MPVTLVTLGFFMAFGLLTITLRVFEFIAQVSIRLMPLYGGAYLFQ